MNYRKIIFYLILICVFGFILGNKQNSLASNQVIRVLFIGNSLTTFNDMPSRVKKMGLMAKEKFNIETFMIASGGDSLDRIVKGRMSSRSQYFKSIESKKWDYIVLQDHSKAPISGRNQMIKAAEILVKIYKKNKANTIFFMTWAPIEKLHQIGEISMVYNNLGKNLDSKVAPVGLAWDYITRNSTIDLYDFDGIHPNKAGTLLTACTIFSTITDQQCEFSSGDFPKNVSKKEMEYLRDTAWKVYTSSLPNYNR
jgi:Domain of unknown function (DUF4886)